MSPAVGEGGLNEAWRAIVDQAEQQRTCGRHPEKKEIAREEKELQKLTSEPEKIRPVSAPATPAMQQSKP